MRIILTLFIVVQSFSLFAQAHTDTPNSDIKIIKNFIQDLSNQDIQTDVILSKYLIVDNPNDELYEYLLVSLDEKRLNVMSKRIEDIQIIHYKDMPKKQVRDIDLENIDAHHVYFLHYKQSQVVALYLKENKIASFTLVSKGNNLAHFVQY